MIYLWYSGCLYSRKMKYKAKLITFQVARLQFTKTFPILNVQRLPLNLLLNYFNRGSSEWLPKITNVLKRKSPNWLKIDYVLVILHSPNYQAIWKCHRMRKSWDPRSYNLFVAQKKLYCSATGGFSLKNMFVNKVAKGVDTFDATYLKAIP